MSRQNNIINKPEPAPGTLGKLDLFGIGFGAVVGAGMVTLMGPAMPTPDIQYGWPCFWQRCWHWL